MNEQILFHLFIFFGCLFLGAFSAKRVLQLTLVAFCVLGLIAVVLQMGSEDSHSFSLLISFVSGGLGMLVRGFVKLVGVSGSSGWLVGFMVGLHRMKVDHERRKGIVRFPFYPSPE